VQVSGHCGNLQTTKVGLWRSYANAANLYDDHWLLAYEAHEHGWLSTQLKSDYVAADPFFSILQSHGVRFYGAGLVATDSYQRYSHELDEEPDGEYNADDTNDTDIPL
jgi:hypothetical protein